jgi:uncharacterized coiled-coil DUF342 family protein
MGKYSDDIRMPALEDEIATLRTQLEEAKNATLIETEIIEARQDEIDDLRTQLEEARAEVRRLKERIAEFIDGEQAYPEA